MPLDKSPADLKLQEDENEGMPLLTYTFSAGNGMTGASQLLLQNNLTDDTMYLQGFEDGTTGWMLDGLPVLFSSDSQPIFLNQTSTEQADTCNTEDNIDVITTNGNENIKEQYLANNETNESFVQDQIYSTEEISNIPNSMDLITTVLTSNTDLNTLDAPSKSYININGLYIPIQQKDTCMQVMSTNESADDQNNLQNEEVYEEIEDEEHVENVDEDVTETTGTNSITLSTEISELADVITAYKCKRCEYTSSDKKQFLNHYRVTHLEQNLNGDNIELVLEENEEVQEPTQYNTIVVSTEQDNTSAELIRAPDFTSVPKYLIETNDGTIEINAHDIQQVGLNNIETYENPAVFTSTIDGNDVETFEEKYILVCSQCSKGFESIEECKQHMINDHKLKEVTGRSDKSKTIHNDHTSSANQTVTTKNNVNVVNSQIEATIGGEALQNNVNKIDAASNEASINDTQALFNKTILKSRKANGSLPFKCQIRGCSYRFATEEVRAEHAKCHVKLENGATGNGISYKCSQCDLPQKSWRATSLHLWRQHGIQTDLITCPVCNSFKATASQLEHHMMTHSDKKTYCCSQCGKFYKQASQLRNHRLIHLDKTSDKRPFWYREKECSQCHKIFSNSKSLKKHLQSVHSKLKPFICNVCGHSCARKAMLQMHLRQHTGEKPYACDFCNYRTGDHNSLRRHNMKHTGLRPYKCPHCPYTSIQSSAYKYHVSNKHPGESGIYSCTLCPFKSVSEDVYTNHLNDHEQGIIPTTKTVVQTTPTNTVTIESKVGQNNGTSTVYFYSTDLTQNTSVENTTQIISNERKSSASSDNEEPCYLRYELLGDEPSVDTGGITIPAEPECSSLLQMALLT